MGEIPNLSTYVILLLSLVGAITIGGWLGNISYSLYKKMKKDLQSVTPQEKEDLKLRLERANQELRRLKRIKEKVEKAKYN